MSLRLFIDECLSPELVDMALQAGHIESSCARDRGQLGLKDWQLVHLLVDADFTLVTHNARDFRGARRDAPGGLYARQAIHPGLICLNSHFGMDLERQRRLFRHALDQLKDMPDLINQVLEVCEARNGKITVDIYDLPAPA